MMTLFPLMPQPFEWIDIPEGKVTLTYIGGYLKQITTFDVPSFRISKYPITNEQFDTFIQHEDGYRNLVWWSFSSDAKKWRMKRRTPIKTGFEGPRKPRTHITWYECVAFCRWLSAVIGEKITLPTDQQWQHATQGDDGRAYPWGNEFDKTKCNVKLSGIGKATHVNHYQGMGDSPFGVSDTIGNVMEWCLTDYRSGKNDLNGASERILRGYSWNSTDFMRIKYHCAYRGWGDIDCYTNEIGFRICSL